MPIVACPTVGSHNKLSHYGALAGPSPLLTQGAQGTAYEGLTFRLSLKFTSEYPFKPPSVRFDTPCFHPNVDTHGNICLDILKEKWSGEWQGCLNRLWRRRCRALTSLFRTSNVPRSVPAAVSIEPVPCARALLLLLHAAAYSVKTVLQSIQSLLADPNVDSPLNAHAAKLWCANASDYRVHVHRMHNTSKPA